jgi:hypothetical protein
MSDSRRRSAPISWALAVAKMLDVPKGTTPLFATARPSGSRHISSDRATHLRRPDLRGRPAGVPVVRFRDEGDRVHHRARRGRRDPEASRKSGDAVSPRPARRGDPPRHLLTPSRPLPSVQSVVIEAAVGCGAGVRSALCRDALSQTPVSTVSEIARGMRAHLGPRICASTPC